MRFLDLEAKSPLYSHFVETFSGLVTIRAFACSGGALGVALSNIVSFSRVLSQMETSLGSISRLKGFTLETYPENLGDEVIDPGTQWPSQGEIKFNGLTASYGLGSNPILQDITLGITPGSKVGICGRSGSGKSSLVLSILRMTDFQHGTITIDGVDLRTTPRESIRQKLTVLPQDPLLLTGSVRLNIDPRSNHTDDEIVSLLDKVGMLDLVLSRGGLSSNLDSSTISSGQQQLICLARGLLHQSTILILDEATSNVDQLRETKLMELIQDQECTVVAVAHRLRTIRNLDLILVMDQGKIVE
ncbi:P-loop containing nucleoside triphosphate hydrolase protein [Penicillium odoratum]|uniref:P-loop containing nucleoside triphosphate hydrolase protein n=1 Tax=Penicillium odoratum TaxID=1167516 RepID=UPI002547A8A9|nr:P-loop containing nucleoside triphosphate hydrolase protein [Penicillium odoratum]KAJ5778147.1 P-loop containing nucleoside triphosphate hydrolase protein [Penicillium odoratum]